MADFLQTHLLEDIGVGSTQVSLVDADRLGAMTCQGGRQLRSSTQSHTTSTGNTRPRSNSTFTALAMFFKSESVKLDVAEAGLITPTNPVKMHRQATTFKDIWEVHHEDEVSRTCSTLQSLQISPPNLNQTELRKLLWRTGCLLCRSTSCHKLAPLRSSKPEFSSH